MGKHEAAVQKSFKIQYQVAEPEAAVKSSKLSESTQVTEWSQFTFRFALAVSMNKSSWSFCLALWKSEGRHGGIWTKFYDTRQCSCYVKKKQPACCTKIARKIIGPNSTCIRVFWVLDQIWSTINTRILQHILFSNVHTYIFSYKTCRVLYLVPIPFQ